MPKDYYQTLGVSKSSSQDEVKAAFRKLAHQFHPDKPTGNAEKFKEINEAYQVVGDPEKRKKYDQFGSAAFDGSGGGGGPFGAGGFDFSGFQQGAGFEDLGDIFGEMFGFGGGGGRARARRGKDIRVDVDLLFKEAIFGAEKELTLTKSSSCDRCGGEGAEPGTEMSECKDCKGSGVRNIQQRTILGTIQTRTMCATCDGRGEIPEKPCSTCGGQGVTKAKKTLRVKIPSGVEDGNVLRVRGSGEAVKGGEPGDLHVVLHVEPDKRFERDGSTIYSTASIGFTQAALGDKIEVETVDGAEALEIPAGTQSGAQIRLRNKGVPERGGRGDHVVVVDVVTPSKLSREQKRLLEELDLRE